MSQYYKPLANSIPIASCRAGVNSSLTNVILDAENGESSFIIQTGDTPALYIDKFGNMGINSTWPTAQLEVASDNGACIRLCHGLTPTSPRVDLFMNNLGDLIINPRTTGSKVKTKSNLDIIDHDGDTIGLTLGGSLVRATAAQLNYTNVTPGAASSSKALVLDNDSSITGVNAITASTLTGTILTSNQPNIISLGALTSLSVSGVADATFSTGSIFTSGGIGMNKALYVGTNITLGGASIKSISTTLNIAANTSNIYIDGSTNQYGFNTQTLQSGYSITIAGTVSHSGIYASGLDTMIMLKNIAGASSSGRTTIAFYSDVGSVLEIGQRNSAEVTVPNGFYIRSTSDLLTLSTTGTLSLPLTSATTALNIGTELSSSFTASRRLIICNNTVAANTRQGIYIGYSVTANNSACFSHYYGASENRLGIGLTGSEDTITVTPAGRVGIANTAPEVPLHVTGSVSLTIGSSGTSYGLLTATDGGSLNIDTSTVELGMRVDAGIHVGSVGVFVTSDRRMKHNIQSIDESAALNFIINTEPRTYQLNHKSNQLGYIAQELRASPFGDLVTFGFEKKDFPAEAQDDVENVLLVAQYERICCILHKGLQNALSRISELEKLVALRGE